MRCPEDERMDPEEVWKHGQHLREVVEKKHMKIVTMAVRFGAGHIRQRTYLEDYLEKVGLGENVHTVDLDLGNSSNKLIQVSEKVYKVLQNSPGGYRTFMWALSLPFWSKIIEQSVLQMAQPERVMQVLEERNLLQRGKEILFATTHGGAASSAVQLLNTREVPGVLTEYNPDPLNTLEMKMLTSPVTFPDGHVVVVHDRASERNYRQAVGFDGRLVLPWGTLSDPEFLLRPEQKLRKTGVPWHVGIEFSGNEIPKFTRRVLKFMDSVAKDVRNGDLLITVHTMCHERSYKNVWRKMSSLGILGGVRILHGDNVNDAVRTRHDYIRGELGEWGPPDMVIAKGGEVPIEDRGRIKVAAVYGSGHEERDIFTGVAEERATDLRKLREDRWWPVMLRRLTDQQEKEYLPPQSWAVLGLLAAVDMSYFGKHFE